MTFSKLPPLQFSNLQLLNSGSIRVALRFQLHIYVVAKVYSVVLTMKIFQSSRVVE